MDSDADQKPKLKEFKLSERDLRRVAFRASYARRGIFPAGAAMPEELRKRLQQQAIESHERAQAEKAVKEQ